ENEISYAVANITIFGLTGMILYPFLANILFVDDPIKAGLFLGTAIHDTAQVTGSALIYDQMYDTSKVVDVATVTKLTRNLFIINKNKEVKTKTLPKWYTFIPLFVIGFLLFSLIRTIGDITLTNSGQAFGIFNPNTWQTIYEGVSSFGTTYLLGMAMAGVGL